MTIRTRTETTPTHDSPTPRLDRARSSLGRWLHHTKPSRSARLAGIAAATGLAGVSAIHVVWATGSAWPYDRAEDLIANVIGGDRFPPSLASLAVAGLLGMAASATLDAVGEARLGRPGRLFALGSAAVLAGRGAGGLLAHPFMKASEPVFAANDLRYFSPLCLLLAAGVAVALWPDPPSGLGTDHVDPARVDQ